MKGLDEVYETKEKLDPISGATEKYRAKLKIPSIHPGQRLTHWIVDSMFLAFVSMFFGQFVGFLFGMMFGGLFILMGAPEESIGGGMMFGVIIAVIGIHGLYYSLLESLGGFTIGRLITKCVVIDRFGNFPSGKTCVLRFLIRLVPFHPFSCLGTESRGWHDEWTGTYLVPKEELPRLRALLKKENGDSDEPGLEKS